MKETKRMLIEMWDDIMENRTILGKVVMGFPIFTVVFIFTVFFILVIFPVLFIYSLCAAKFQEYVMYNDTVNRFYHWWRHLWYTNTYYDKEN